MSRIYQVVAVNDEPVMRDAVGTFLAREQGDLLSFHGGECSLRHCDYEPASTLDIVLMDIAMPR